MGVSVIAKSSGPKTKITSGIDSLDNLGTKSSPHMTNTRFFLLKNFPTVKMGVVVSDFS